MLYADSNVRDICRVNTGDDFGYVSDCVSGLLGLASSNYEQGRATITP
jgi:hypothetical protein